MIKAQRLREPDDLMQKLLSYLLVFGFPIVAYAVWLARFSNRLHFFLLLAGIVVTIWGLLWPLDAAAGHWKATEGPGDKADSIVNGFVFLGWLPGLLGCLPVILVEIARSVVLLMRRRTDGGK